MSIYHQTVKIVGRSKGMDATAAAAYITRSEVEDRTTGQTYDHTHHKDKAIHTERYLPEKHPEWAEVKSYKKGKHEYLDYGELWNLVEERETRKDSQFARNFNLAAQSEFTDEENLECFASWIKQNFTSRGIIVDGAFHEAHVEQDGSSNRNMHFHALATIRQVDENGWLDKKDREANSKEFLERLRKSWADINNAMFERKFCRKHQEEYDEIFEEIKDIIPDEEERKRETIELLYDKYPAEWIFISEKTLDDQRLEIEEQLEEEEGREELNLERITRLEKKFLSIPFEAQRHLGAKAKNMQRKGKQTDRKACDNDQMRKNRELEKELAAVEVTEEELEKALSDDEEYLSLNELKKRILAKASESIEDEEEVKMIREQVEKLSTPEEMEQWKKNVWKPIEIRIRQMAERNAAYEDIKSEHSEIIATYEETPLGEMTEVQQIAVKERKKSVVEFKEIDKNNVFTDSGEQKEELGGIISEMTLLQRVSNKFKNVLSKIKEKAGEIIENSPLKKFKIFRVQRQIVDSWKPKLNMEVISDGTKLNDTTINGRADKSAVGRTGETIDFIAGVDAYSRRVDAERAERAAEEAARLDRQHQEASRRRVKEEQGDARGAAERTENRNQFTDDTITEQHGKSDRPVKKHGHGGRGR